MSTALVRSFADTCQRTERAVIQVAESHLASCPIESVDVKGMEYRQLYAFPCAITPKRLSITEKRAPGSADDRY